MSLYASLHGDIWSLSGISFASPINDILDRGGYTLEELLNEDELIQEVKTGNERLIEFLCSLETLEKLLDFIIVPAQPDDSAERKHRYPYLSCEVICCETPAILNRIVNNKSGSAPLLDKLVSLLDQEGELSCHLAGYFEKILEMLFRKMTVQMMAYFNAAGNKLFVAFSKHIYNYSIMQVIQRLMLPHIPFNSEAAADNNNNNNSMDAEAGQMEPYCYWSMDSKVCKLLVDTMLSCQHTDIPLHISDLIITVLQLSPPETLLVNYLCQAEVMDSLMTQAIQYQDAAEIDLLDPTTSGLVMDEHPASRKLLQYNISVAATAVMESLISRLYEAEYALQEMMENAQLQGNAGQNANVENIQVQLFINNICSKMVTFIPSLRDVLTQQQRNPRALGHHGLQLVKLIEAIVRLGNEEIEEELCKHGLFDLILQYYFLYEDNSILHLSVQRIVVMLLEAAESRSNTQIFMLSHCELLKIIMQRVSLIYPRLPTAANAPKRVPSTDSLTNNPSDEEGGGEEAPGQKETVVLEGEGEGEGEARGSQSEEKDVQDGAEPAPKPEASLSMAKKIAAMTIRNKSRHSSVMGNLILIGQGTLVALEDVDPNGNDQRATAQKPAETSDFDQFNALTPDATIGQPAEGPLDSMPHGYLRAKFANESSLQPLLKEWDRFVQGKLKPIIDHNFHGIGHIAPSEDKHVAEVRVVCQEEDGDLVLIDTAGRDDFDEDRLGEGESDPFQKTQFLGAKMFASSLPHSNSDSDSSSDEEDDHLFNQRFAAETEGSGLASHGHSQHHGRKPHHAADRPRQEFADFAAFSALNEAVEEAGQGEPAATMVLDDIDFDSAFFPSDPSPVLAPTFLEEVDLSEKIVADDDIFSGRSTPMQDDDGTFADTDVDFGDSKADDW